MIKIQKVSKNFKDVNVLKSVSLNIKEGIIYGIIGKSGAGKSTLLRCLNGLETYDSGSLEVMGQEVKTLSNEDLRKFRKDLGMIFQNFNLLQRKTVFENVALPLEVWGFDKTYINSRVLDLLDLVGLAQKAKSKPKELSGGQKQRVAIARALALNPKILLCDEATSALDPKTTKDILNLLAKINKELKITIVIVTHQMEVIKDICEKVALIEDGEIKIEGNVKDVFFKPENNLKRFIGDNEKTILPDEGINIKIFFPSSVSENSLITKMARELDIDFSIVWGKLEKFRENILGSLVINIDKNFEEKVLEYLKNKNIPWEVL